MDRGDIRILGVIPARGGSKRIPRKNLVDFCGKPLIQHTFEAAMASRELDRVILSTDNEEIAEVGKNCGIEVPFPRPEQLAEDETPMPLTIKHAVQWMQREEGEIYEAAAVLQPTSPLRRTGDIDKALRVFREGSMDALVGVCEFREHPFEIVIQEGKWARYFIPRKSRQNFPPCYFVSGAMFIVLSQVLVQQETLFPKRMSLFFMDWLSSLDVDTSLDLKIAAFLMQLREEGEID